MGFLGSKRIQSLLRGYSKLHMRQQIADMLGRPLGTVSSWFQRALPKLRDCILRKLDKQEANWPDLRRELGLGNSG